ncbi:radical SAM protein [Candidatus Marithrix sp. Canyon 246]|uniref:radical SAM protein n=1 Tax=Candidatus Marithrix sp. Canyon 246 TaxID=1827136 RepID=UPI00084A0D14|nr:radical SAM protein [Candidatus Marithrix sp. Canyon 246]
MQNKSIETINNDLLNKSFQSRSFNVLASPNFIKVEVSNICNLHCIMCPIDDIEAPKRKLTLDEFKHILSQFPFLTKIGLYGIGEPLNNPRIYEMIKICHDRNIETEFVSNATLFNETRINKLIEAGLSNIYISIDSVNPQKYESIRVGSNFEKVIQNLKTLIDCKKAANSKTPLIGISTVTMSENVKELIDIINFISTLEIDRLIITGLNTTYTEQNISIKQDFNQDLNKVLQLCKKINQSGKLKIKFFHENKAACSLPWNSVFITVNGDVTPCMNCADSSIISFGNIFQQNFLEIWNNQQYQNFRTSFRSQIPTVCKPCPDYSFDYLNSELPAKTSLVYDNTHNISCLNFTEVKTVYQINEPITIDLEDISQITSYSQVDLLVAIQRPDGRILYLTNDNSEPFSIYPKPFKKSRIKSKLRLLNLPKIPDTFQSGEYNFYAVYYKQNAPFSNLEKNIRSNIAKHTILISKDRLEGEANIYENTNRTN